MSVIRKSLTTDIWLLTTLFQEFGMLMTEKPKNLWQRLDGPLKVGLVFAALGIILTIVGIFRDPTTPITAWSLGVGSLISGVTWGLVSWAIATAAVEVENDISQAEAGAGQDEPK